jgi:hypothetical protein
LQSLQDEVKRSHETFIKHYLNTYTNPAPPPIWAVCEVLTLGQLSQWLDNLKYRPDRQVIAQALGFDEVVVCAFAHHLATVRNLCAHHSQVWNRKFTVRMKLPRHPRHVLPWFNVQEDHKVYNTLLMLTLLLERVCPDNTWKSRLVRLIAQMPAGTTDAMDFPVANGRFRKAKLQRRLYGDELEKGAVLSRPVAVIATLIQPGPFDYLVYPGAERFPLRHGAQAIGLAELTQQLMG